MHSFDLVSVDCLWFAVKKFPACTAQNISCAGEEQNWCLTDLIIVGFFGSFKGLGCTQYLPTIEKPKRPPEVGSDPCVLCRTSLRMLAWSGNGTATLTPRQSAWTSRASWMTSAQHLRDQSLCCTVSHPLPNSLSLTCVLDSFLISVGQQPAIHDNIQI
jgi:hypothetical protein